MEEEEESHFTMTLKNHVEVFLRADVEDSTLSEHHFQISFVIKPTIKEWASWGI